MRSIETGEYLVMIGDGATVLCKRHLAALAAAFAAAQQTLEAFEVDPEDGAISCQACHMAATQDSPEYLQ
jgi:hypothetical protein